jgi:hypothetical protein
VLLRVLLEPSLEPFVEDPPLPLQLQRRLYLLVGASLEVKHEEQRFYFEVCEVRRTREQRLGWVVILFAWRHYRRLGFV